MWVVVTAAGSGRRMGGGNKLLLEVDGVPILVRTLRVFEDYPAVQGVYVSAPPEQVEVYRQLFADHGLARVRGVVAGGAERQHSILNVLQVLPADAHDPVAIHDGARPFIEAELLDRLLAALPHWDGVLPMVAVKDTVKRVQAGRVLETLDRSQLFAAQTPQVFPFATILAAHRRARDSGWLGTDDASLVESAGGRVGKIEGDYSNLKVTTPEDLEWAERWLRTRVVRG